MEAKVRIGDLGYRIQKGRTRGTELAFFVAPTSCSDGIARHVAVIFDTETEDLYNVHLTDEGMGRRWKQWSKCPNRFGSDVIEWFKTHSSLLETASAKRLGPDYYCVSGWRVYVGLRLSMGIMSIADWLLFRPLASLGIAQFKVKEDRVPDRISATGRIDMTRMVEILQKLRPFKRIVKAVLPVVVLKMAPKIAKLCLLTRVERMSRGDALLMIPKREEKEPLVLLKGDDYRQISAVTVFEKAFSLYRKMELGELFPDPNRIMSSGLSIPFAFEGTATRPVA